MKAMAATGPGDASVLSLIDCDTPSPGPGELLVKVEAVGLNPVDYKIRQGYLSERRSYPAILGFDVAGVVAEVGPETSSDFGPGDEVFYYAPLTGQGAYADYHVIKAALVAAKPESLTFVEAASLPIAGSTAWQALVTQGGLAAGETLLIQGAAGGVGSMAVQIGKARGATVIGLCSEENAAYVRSLGADQVIDYRSDDVVATVADLTGGQGADCLLDTVGGETFFYSFALVRPLGRLAFLNAFAAGDSIDRLNPARLRNLTIIPVMVIPSRTTLESLAELVASGKLIPQVDQVIGLADIPEAHKRLEGRHGRGKIVADLSA